jgi:hypothetical protein
VRYVASMSKREIPADLTQLGEARPVNLVWPLLYLSSRLRRLKRLVGSPFYGLYFSYGSKTVSKNRYLFIFFT